MNNTNIISKLVDDYKSMLIAQNGRLGRLSQVDDILNALIKKFKVDGPINIIETGASQSWGDGMMGTLFANIAKHTGGKMWVVDIDPIITEKAKAEFTKLGFDFVKFHVGDSVEFLETSKYVKFAPLDGPCNEVVNVPEEVTRVLCYRCTSRSASGR